jgi:hypothetical protein
MAKQAPAVCATCGFYVRLEGLLGQTFGACSNEYSPADGRVVDAAYGCGAHSETVVDAPLISASSAAVMDEVTLEVHLRPVTQAPAPAEPDGDASAAEPVDRIAEPVAETEPSDDVAEPVAETDPAAESADQAEPTDQPEPDHEPDQVPEPVAEGEPAGPTDGVTESAAATSAAGEPLSSS